MLVKHSKKETPLYRRRERAVIEGGVAQMVERSLSMREVPGSIPGASTFFFYFCFTVTWFLSCVFHVLCEAVGYLAYF